jgi:chromate transport protein ChrA
MQLTTTAPISRTRFSPDPYIAPLALLAIVASSHWAIFYLYRWLEPQKGPSFQETVHGTLMGMLAMAVAMLATTFLEIFGKNISKTVRLGLTCVVFAGFALA